MVPVTDLPSITPDEEAAARQWLPPPPAQGDRIEVRVLRYDGPPMPVFDEPEEPMEGLALAALVVQFQPVFGPMDTLGPRWQWRCLNPHHEGVRAS
jgi:hypothetical protein